MASLKEIKEEINQIKETLYRKDTLDHSERSVLKARHNSKAREYNRRKKFYQLKIGLL